MHDCWLFQVNPDRKVKRAKKAPAAWLAFQASRENEVVSTPLCCVLIVLCLCWRLVEQILEVRVNCEVRTGVQGISFKKKSVICIKRKKVFFLFIYYCSLIRCVYWTINFRHLHNWIFTGIIKNEATSRILQHSSMNLHNISSIINACGL